jgi:hypothetical protein
MKEIISNEGTEETFRCAELHSLLKALQESRVTQRLAPGISVHRVDLHPALLSEEGMRV